MKALIVYGSNQGQTEKISKFLAEEMKSEGVETTVLKAVQTKAIDKVYDLIIVAGSIHLGSYQKSITRFIKTNLKLLQEKPSSFISVSLTAAGNNAKDWADLENITKTYLQKLNWQPEHVLQVAGALRYSKYNFLIKYIMKRIASKNMGETDTSRDYEYTDWEQLRAYVKMLLNSYKIEA